MYNVGKYLDTCLNSVINQSIFDDMEVCCIDDGSIDNTLETLAKYQKKYNNIFLIQQNHQGAGPARNKGIALAKGKYICFLDSDDYYYDNHVLELLYEKAEQNNVKVCGGSQCKIYGDKVDTKYSGMRSDLTFKTEGVRSYSEYQFHLGFCRFIYNRELILQHNIVFPNFKRYQDPYFMVMAMLASQTFYHVPQIIYYHRVGYKSVEYTKNIVIDYGLGMSELLDVASKYKLEKLHSNVCENLHETIKKYIYQYLIKKDEDIIRLTEKINRSIDAAVISKYRQADENPLLYTQDEMPKYIEQCQKERKRWEKLIYDGDKLLFYGAGKLARETIEFLNTQRIGKIHSCIVTHLLDKEKTIKGIPIISLEQVDKNKRDYVIIIPETSLYKEEMVATLVERGYSKYEVLNFDKIQIANQ